MYYKIDSELLEEMVAYINSNLHKHSKRILKYLLRYLGYRSLRDYIQQTIKDYFDLELAIKKDQMFKMDVVTRYKKLEKSNIFTPVRLLKKTYVDMSMSLLNTINIMAINYSRSKEQFTDYDYRDYLASYLSVLADIDRRRKGLFNWNWDDKKMEKYLLRELNAIESIIENKNRKVRITHQFKFLKSEQKLLSLCLQLEKSGFINNALIFSEIFKVKGCVNNIVESKIRWNGKPLELIYLFRILIEFKLIDESERSLLSRNLSDLFLNKSDEPLSNKNLGNSISRYIYGKQQPFKGNPRKSKRLQCLFDVVKANSQ